MNIARIGAVTACVFVAAGSELRGQSEANWREVERALRKDGFRAAARVAGEYVGSARFEECTVVGDLEGLAHFSTAIIVGQIGENRPHLSADGRAITTDFRVTVVEALKGPVSVGDTISVGIPGGKIVFEDGTSAELRPGEFRCRRAASVTSSFSSGVGISPPLKLKRTQDGLASGVRCWRRRASSPSQTCRA